MIERKRAIFGALIGDYFGSAFELSGRKPSSILDIIGAAESCDYTDDSKMTCAIASAIMLSDSGSGPDCAKAEEFAVTEMRRIGRQYPGGYGGMFSSWIHSENPKPYDSFGNGACMRVSPAGLSADSLQKAMSMAEAVTKVTHNHPQALAYAKIVAGLVYMAKSGASKRRMVDFIREKSKEFRIDCYKQIEQFDLERLHSFYSFDVTCEGSVPQAIFCFLESASFGDFLRRVMYIGGDTDTIGAIACSIAAPYYGDDQLVPFIKAMRRPPRDFRGILALFTRRYLC